jgi:uncharacterized protein
MKNPVVDAHVHPAFFEQVCSSDEQLRLCRAIFGLHKTGRSTLEEVLTDNDVAAVDRMILLPLDLTTTLGGSAATNEDVCRLVETEPDRFIGFASVDPHRGDALEVVEHSFRDLDLKGLKLHPSRQLFSPDSPEMWPLYELCVAYDRPIIFHAGMSAEPDTLSKYAHPMNFESVAHSFPQLRFCLAHCGWPWVRETCMLLFKYPNVYADTAFWYFDSPQEFFEQVFAKDMGPHWIDRSFRHQLMFGSNAPRFGVARMIRALRELEMRPSTLELVLGGNATRFLGG